MKVKLRNSDNKTKTGDKSNTKLTMTQTMNTVQKYNNQRLVYSLN